MDSVDLVRSFYQALADGNGSAALQLFDSSIEWLEAEKSPYYSGTWYGPDAVRRNLFEPLARDWKRFDVVPDSFLTEEPFVVAFGTYSGTHKATGKSFRSPFAHLWQVERGKLKSFRQYTD